MVALVFILAVSLGVFDKMIGPIVKLGLLITAPAIAYFLFSTTPFVFIGLLLAVSAWFENANLEVG